MNGIYDFDGYRTPQLNIEMLMERKARKREKQMLILSCIAAVIMTIVAIVMLIATALIDQKIFVIATVVFAVYVVIGAACVGRFMKRREEELWHQLV